MRRTTHFGIALLLISLLLYTRFVNLGWGLPYPMHPDERNMADAMTRIHCDKPLELLNGMITVAPQNVLTFIRAGEMYLPKGDITCLNPNFFAYGQMSLYVGYFFALIIAFLSSIGDQTYPFSVSSIILFQDAIMGLRFYSALVSCVIPFVALRLLGRLHKDFNKPIMKYIAFLCLTFSPVLIQFAHYGTTEAVLMLLYLLIVDTAVKSLQDKKPSFKDLSRMSMYIGLAIATKASSLLYLMIPGFVILIKQSAVLMREIDRLLSSRIRALVCHPDHFDFAQYRLRGGIPLGRVEMEIYHELVLDSPAQESERVCSNDNSASPRFPLSTIVFQSILVAFRHGILAFVSLITVILFSGIVSFIFSPHNILSLRELLGSMHYETDVGLGTYVAFYTRQFLVEQPLIFHVRHIFPYALGPGIFVFSILGLILLPRTRSSNLLRFAMLAFFFLTAPWYAKWTRFIGPLYPLMIVCALLFSAVMYRKIVQLLNRDIKSLRGVPSVISSSLSRAIVERRNRKRGGRSNLKHAIVIVWLVVCIVPGIAFLSVYGTRDIRFVASDWIYKNIKSGSYVLSETANVIDTPIPDVKDKKQHIPPDFNIRYISFNLYDLDTDSLIQSQLRGHLKNADYIFVPSRRVFYNHTCRQEFPIFPAKPRSTIGTKRDPALQDNSQFSNKSTETTSRHSKTKCEYLRKTYPLLDKYYDDLFSGRLGFQKVAEFTSYPRIDIFGKTLISFPDENAEETFTVFDHPVMRVYEKTQKPSPQNYLLQQ